MRTALWPALFIAIAVSACGEEHDCPASAPDGGMDSGSADSGHPDGARDGGPTDADLEDGASAVEGCQRDTNGDLLSEEPPERPDPSTNGNSLPDETVLVMKDITLALDADHDGLNLDGRCTGLDGPWSCLPGPELEKLQAGGDPIPPIDGLRGIDNVFAEDVFPVVNTSFVSGENQDLEQRTREAENQGFGNFILRLADYDGDGDDSSVTAVVSQSVFAVKASPGATTAPSICIQDTESGDIPCTNSPCVSVCDPAPQPGVDGTDPEWESGDLWLWGRDDTYVAGEPLIKDDGAYVVDDTVVARLPDGLTIKLVSDGQVLEVQLTDAHMLATLTRDPGGEIVGSEPQAVMIAGRWPVAALLRAAEAVGICSGSSLYQTAMTTFNSVADVTADPAAEGTTALCDAVSFAMKFTAYRGNWGGLASGPPTTNACADAAGDAGDAGVDGG